MARDFVLNEPEVLFLASHLRNLTNLSDAAAVRLDISGGSLGCYHDVDDSLISFIALPLAQAVAEPIAAVVSAGRLRDVIGDVRKREGATSIALPDDVDVPAGLLNLPPREGWQPGFKGIAGDLTASIDEQIAASAAKAELLPAQLRTSVLRETWLQPDWSSLPRGVLHVARQLGFLNLAPAPVAASTNGPWKRLVTPMGQVFSRASDNIAKLSAPRGK